MIVPNGTENPRVGGSIPSLGTIQNETSPKRGMFYFDPVLQGWNRTLSVSSIVSLPRILTVQDEGIPSLGTTRRIKSSSLCGELFICSWQAMAR